jgi:hypothetical protein
MGTAVRQDLYNMGCSQGGSTPDSTSIVVVLDYGYPWHDSANGTYGAKPSGEASCRVS